MRHVCTAVAAAALAAGGVSAQVRINEILVNSPGTDQNFEFIELKSNSPNFSMAGLTLLIIEGDNGAQGLAGTIDQALDLGSFSTGSNRLFLWRDSVNVLNPAPDAATVVHVADFVPDIENGSNTFMIVSGFTGVVGQDLDTNNDGVLDITPWTAIIDSFGYRAGDPDPQFSLHRVYSPNDLSDVPDGFTPDAVARIGTAFFGFDVQGTGPFLPDALELSSFPANLSLPTDFILTPGSHNIGDADAPTCPADFNGSGVVTVQDIYDFLADWSAQVSGQPPILGSADFNGSGVVTVQDIYDFLGAWTTPCL